ncbi:uncharacterized protein LOC113022540 isoform X1 [Astatotilapia calliptera]|uniref:uncharacterized protein LOC113022540 isoform X1 n=1 Tax=Astatotilapia calliptera TaxID=8154 RepID=UPI000E3FDC0B|nr:uncharacterized protein LOC113022540 isoform X1 [Astatotilapia calliptera]
MHSATFPENQTQTPTVQPHNLGTLQSLNRPGTLLYTKTESSEAVCATAGALLPDMLLSDKVTQHIVVCVCVKRVELGAVYQEHAGGGKGKKTALRSFQARAQNILAEESPSCLPTPADRSLEQNENNVAPSHGGNSALDRTTGSPLPPLTQDEGAGTLKKTSVSPRNMSQYRNVFNERARTGFCYWLVEKSPTCKGCSLGAYKTFLGLPKV